MFKRIGLFMLTNLVIIITISVLLNLLGVGGYLSGTGINYEALLVFCAVWGMGGAFISLAMSRMVAKWSMGVQIIDPNNPGEFSGLLNTVHELARSAGLPAMPEVGVYHSPEVNAFATGPTKSRALVAVSSGLLSSMNRDQVEGVLGHEIAHIANGDMVTMTLIQGVVNAFVMFFARVLSFAISQALASRSSDGERVPNHMVMMLLTVVFELVFGLLGMIVVSWFSRQREFRADRGGAEYAGRGKMVSALQALQRALPYQPPEKHESLATMKMSSQPGGALRALFMTHPPLEVRIARLLQQQD